MNFRNPSRHSTACVWLALISISANAATDFNRDIKPIFADRCYSCHGAEKQKNGLRLDSKTAAMAGGESGAVIKPGRSGESILFKNIAGLDPEKIMPPKGERLTLTQIEL